jgi:hypothetical protein
MKSKCQIFRHFSSEWSCLNAIAFATAALYSSVVFILEDVLECWNVGMLRHVVGKTDDSYSGTGKTNAQIM